MDILEGIARGERAIREGRTLSKAEARKKMIKWLALSRRIEFDENPTRDN